MERFRSPSIGCCWILAGILGGSTCQADGPTAPADQAPAELLQVIEQQGSVLTGTLLDPAQAEGDSPATSDTATAPAAVRRTWEELLRCQVPTTGISHDPPSAEDVQPSVARGTVPETDESSLAAEVRAIRRAARTLDDLAAALEEQQLYDFADTLRDTARGFWIEARGSLSSSSETDDGPEVPTAERNEHELPGDAPIAFEKRPRRFARPRPR